MKKVYSFVGFLAMHTVFLPVMIVYYMCKSNAIAIVFTFLITIALSIFGTFIYTAKISITDTLYTYIPIWTVFLVGGLVVLILLLKVALLALFDVHNKRKIVKID